MARSGALEYGRHDRSALLGPGGRYRAPSDIQELSLKMVLDEQRHAHLCIAAAQSLGAEPEVTFDLEELQQLRTRTTL